MNKLFFIIVLCLFASICYGENVSIIPDSDTSSTGTWTITGGTGDKYTAIDEEVLDTNDYITNTVSARGTFIFGTNVPTIPLNATNITLEVFWVHKRADGDVPGAYYSQAGIRYDGSTWTNTTSSLKNLTGTWTEVSYVYTGYASGQSFTPEGWNASFEGLTLTNAASGNSLLCSQLYGILSYTIPSGKKTMGIGSILTNDKTIRFK
jgi:hypothetical protein